jgi:hypothetical protein
MSNEIEQKIRDKAHELWVLDGQPEGRELFHWDLARQLVLQENTAEFTLVPTPPCIEDLIDPLAAPDNLREIPDLTHLGEDAVEPEMPLKKVAGARG